MPTLAEAAQEFLAQKRLAVAGVSRTGNAPANSIYKKLRDSGYEVFAVNPNAEEVEGDPCFFDLAAIPGGIDAVVIATHPQVTLQVVQDCADLGIRRVWMHRSLGDGSVNDEAVRRCQENGISVIPGSCPMMFLEPVDVGHKCMRWFMRFSGRQPKPKA